MALGNVRSVAEHVLLLGDDAGSFRHVGVTAGGDLYTFAHRTLTQTEDTTLNDSDKTITVPAGRLWWLHYVYALFTTTATVGNRRIALQIGSSGGIHTYEVSAGAVQAAGLTRIYSFAPAVPQAGAFIDLTINVPIPTRAPIAAGGLVRIVDNNAIAATADDFDIRLVYDEIII